MKAQAMIMSKENKFEPYVLKNVIATHIIEDSIMITYLSDDKSANRIQNGVYNLEDVQVTVTI